MGSFWAYFAIFCAHCECLRRRSVKGVPLVRGEMAAQATWRAKNHEKIEIFEKLRNGSGRLGMHGNGMGGDIFVCLRQYLWYGDMLLERYRDGLARCRVGPARFAHSAVLCKVVSCGCGAQNLKIVDVPRTSITARWVYCYRMDWPLPKPDPFAASAVDAECTPAAVLRAVVRTMCARSVRNVHR